MEHDLEGETCTIEMGILRGESCWRKAVCKVTELGRHVGFLCKDHQERRSVWHWWNMVEGLKAKRGTRWLD